MDENKPLHAAFHESFKEESTIIEPVSYDTSKEESMIAIPMPQDTRMLIEMGLDEVQYERN